jgi:hypothetical protein
MIRITGGALLLAPGNGDPLLDLHPFVDNQCCIAISHLQHMAGIPN